MATKKRRIVIPSLAYGEGSDDEEFLRYIKRTYAQHKTVKFDNGHGGSPTEVVATMLRRNDFSAYGSKIVLFDDDRPETKEAISNAKEKQILPVVSQQCIEYELLKIIGANKKALSRAKTSSQNAKKEFAKYGCEHTQESYAKNFPKDQLDKTRKTNNWLNAIIEFFEKS